MSHAVCSKCGLVVKMDIAKRAEGWIIEEIPDAPDHVIIRCPLHATDYSRRRAGLKQTYYQTHKTKGKK